MSEHDHPPYFTPHGPTPEKLSEQTSEHRSVTKRTTRLWAGMLLPPIGWLFELEAVYALTPKACAQGSMLAVWIAHAIAVTFPIVAFLCAQKEHAFIRQLGEGGHLSTTRAKFMAWSGLSLSAFFLIVILLEAVPSLVLHPCEVS